MTAIAISRISPWKRRLNRVRNYLSKPQNAILLALGIILTITTIWPAFSIVRDTVTIHQGTVDTRGAAEGQVYTTYNWTDLFAPATNTARKLAQINLWTPLLNSVLLSVFACIGSIFYGGLFAYLVTRTNLKFKKYLSSIFIFPYIMPQWTLAVIWRNLFNSNLITKGADGLFASVLGIRMPLWWCQGMFPSAVVLALHYAPFAYILIGGIFRNMDANLEEAENTLK